MENEPNGCRISDPCTTCFRPLHTLSLSTVRLLFSMIMKCVTYSMLYEKSDLFYIHSIKQSWKDMENGRKWSRKVPENQTHIKRSWKLMENHFQCSVCTLFKGCFSDEVSPVMLLNSSEKS